MQSASRKISSQRYLDAAIVAVKRDAEDYEVTLVPVDVEGIEYHVVVDGHHSLAAARADGVSPEFLLDTTSEVAREALRDSAAWMAQHQMDSDWYDIETMRDVW